MMEEAHGCVSPLQLRPWNLHHCSDLKHMVHGVMGTQGSVNVYEIPFYIIVMGY